MAQDTEIDAESLRWYKITINFSCVLSSMYIISQCCTPNPILLFTVTVFSCANTLRGHLLYNNRRILLHPSYSIAIQALLYNIYFSTLQYHQEYGFLCLIRHIVESTAFVSTVCLVLSTSWHWNTAVVTMVAENFVSHFCERIRKKCNRKVIFFVSTLVVSLVGWIGFKHPIPLAKIIG